MFKTHLIISILIGLLTFEFFEINWLIFILLVVLAGILPDIDIPTSTVGSLVKPLSNFINMLFGHRGIMHSIFVPIMLLLVFVYFNKFEYGMAILIGYVGHLIADAVSLEGINFLHPFFRFKVRGFIKVGGFLEYVIFIALLFFSFVEMLKLALYYIL